MLDSIIRTLVAKLVGLLVGLAVALGVVVPTDMSQAATTALTLAVGGLVEMAYYVLGRAVEQRFPAAGRVLLSLGAVGRSPSYTR